MKTEEIIALITGNVSEDRKNDLLPQIKKDDLLQKEYNALKNVWALSSHDAEMSGSRVEKAYLIQRAKIKRQSIPVRLYSFLKYAAILLIVFGAGIIFDKYFTSQSESNKGITEIVVPLGQTAEIYLPDGSHAWINSDTRLSFSNTFSDKKRDVILRGEAYFKVRKDKSPFVVSTKFGDITVLGTSFNVHAYNDSKFQATLVEGSIRYTNEERNRNIVLSPGQQLSFSEEDGIRVNDVKTNLYTSWKDGVIIFKKEPLKEVVRKLERHFDVKIVLEDRSLENIRFTGNIGNENLLDVLEYIDKTKPIQYTYNRKSKKLTIRQRE
jgi:ferric-dicitrate binding protein FerR (iron transport regulator)